MTDPSDLDAGTLKRRVLLAAVLTLVLFVTASYVVSALGVGQGWLLAVLVLLYVGVTRPLMAPVREASALRRRLAYQAYLEGRGVEGRGVDGRRDQQEPQP